MSVCKECNREYDETMFLQYPSCLIEQESSDEKVDCQNTNGKVKIAEVFSENAYNLFVKYCTAHNLKYINDLRSFDFNELRKVPGIGKKKIDSIIARFRKFPELAEKNLTKEVENVIDTMFNEIDESILDLNIGCLNTLDIKLRTLHTLESNGYTYLRDLENISREQLTDIVGKRNIEKFENIQQDFKKNLTEFLEIVLENLSDKEEYKMFLKRANGFTLQEIANEREITRERVRQILKNFNLKISIFIDLIIKRAIDQKGYATVQELLGIYNNDDYDKILISSCIQNEQLEYLDFADVFVAKRKDEKSTEDIIFQIASEFVGDGKDLYENSEELEMIMSDKGFPYIQCGEFINLIQKYGYRLYGHYAVKGKQSYGYLCSMLVAKEFPNGIKLYESKDLDKLRKLALREYGDLGLPDSNRALSARISNFLILCGRGMAIAEKNVHVEMSTIDEIKECIDRSEESIIFYTELFSKFERILKITSNIYNYNFLHGILMLYYPDEYDYSKDYLQKKSTGNVSGSLTKRIKDFIISKNRPVSKNELKAEFAGFSDAMIVRAVSEDKDLFQWEYNYYSCIQIISIDNSIINYLKSIIKYIMDANNGYCSEGMLYETAKELLGNFMDVNNVVFPINLFYICACLFDGLYDFRHPHIGQKGVFHDVSTKNVVLHLLGDTGKISFKKYSVTAERFKWSAATTGSVFANIESDYVRVSYDTYIRKDLFSISDTAIHEIESKLVKFMKFSILPLINFNEWDELPDIRGYGWNIFLLNSIICNFGCKLRIIDPRIKDRRYQKGIIVYKDSKLTEYPEVITYVLKQNGMTELSEGKLLSFMVTNGLTYKVIPRELYNAGCINYINGKFLCQ